MLAPQLNLSRNPIKARNMKTILGMAFSLLLLLALSPLTVGELRLKSSQQQNDEAAKKNLFSVFEIMKPDDPEALKARRKLSSLIFS